MTKSAWRPRRAIQVTSESCPHCGSAVTHQKTPGIHYCHLNKHLLVYSKLPSSRSILRRAHRKFGIGVSLGMITRMEKTVRVRAPSGFAEMDEDEVTEFLSQVYQDDDGSQGWEQDNQWGCEEGTHDVFDRGDFARKEDEESDSEPPP